MTVPPLDEEEEDSEDGELDEDDISEDEVDSDLELDPETEKNTQINAQTKPAKSVLKREHKTETMVKKVKFQKKDHDSNSEDSYFSEDDDDDIKDDDDSDDDDEEEDINDGDNSDDTDDGDDKKITLATDSKSGLSEDIYGRLRDQKGNVVPVSKASEAYVPPAKRKQITRDTDKRKVILDRLRKQMKGLINRLVILSVDNSLVLKCILPIALFAYIKEPLLLIRKSSPCGGSGFPLSLSEWSFTICLTPYNRK